MKTRQAASPLPTARPFKLPPALALARPAPAKPARSEAASLIGAQVRALRIASGASGGELARRSGISRSLLSRIEHGVVSPSVATLARVATGLDVPIS